MSNRKLAYLIGVSLLAILCTSPHILLGMSFASEMYLTGRFPSFSRWTLSEFDPLSYAPFWRNQFITFEYRVPSGSKAGTYEFRALGIDPETRKSTEILDWLPVAQGVNPMAFSDRLLLIGQTESFEWEDGKARRFDLVSPPFYVQPGCELLWEGLPAGFQRGATGYVLQSLDRGRWGNACELDLPQGKVIVGGQELDFSRADGISCVNQGDKIHVFLHIGPYLLYREGLKVKASPGVRLTRFFASLEQPPSALTPENTREPAEGWTLVRKELIDRAIWNEHSGMLVGGVPVAMVFDGTPDGRRIGKLYRFDGDAWSEFAEQEFPFGTTMLRTLTAREESKAYIMATTSAGCIQLYAVEPSGIREIPAFHSSRRPFLRVFSEIGIIFLIALIVGVLLGLGTWLLMQCFTSSAYSFGRRHIELASLGPRGLARLIDIALVLLTTIGFGWLLTRDLDWLTLAEAINLKVSHPMLDRAIRAGSLVCLAVLAVRGAFLVMEARYGVTPGKWCCGLRTLRTTLKPCGLARSLAREIAFFLDCCNLLCWTPGIYTIALSDRRQRLGDFVADTIVVRAKSLQPRDPASESSPSGATV